MNPLRRISLAFFIGILIACNHREKTTSPYDDILSQAPFSSLTDSINRDPKNDHLLFRRAVLLNQNNFPEPALLDFRKAWSLQKNEQYAFGIGMILMKLNSDSAIAFLREAISVLPNSTLLELSIARAFDAKGMITDALQQCEKILSKNPAQVDVLKFKADLLDKTGRSDSAIITLEKAYMLAPYDIDLNYALAFKYAQDENPKTISLCDSLIRIDTLHLHAEPYYYKGIYFSNTGDKIKAVGLFDKAIELNYQYLNAYIEKGSALLDQKKTADAFKTFQLANTISPKFPDAWYWMARCQEISGDIENARLNYSKALGLDPGFSEAKEALDRLK